MQGVRIAGCGLLIVLTLAACSTRDEPPAQVGGRVRAYVEKRWNVSAKAEAGQLIGFNGTYYPSENTRLPMRCDSGPVGAVTYTTAATGVVCATYPYRQPDGTIRAKVAVASPRHRVIEHDLEKEGGGLGLPRGDGLLLSPNPENETPEDRIAAEKSRIRADCQPADIEQAMICLDSRWPAETRQAFASMTAGELVPRTHFGIGMWMRNNWGLWRGGTLQAFFRTQKVDHPDDMSGVLLRAYWLKSHGCVMAWNNAAAVRDRFERAEHGEPCARP